ncbi:hypothetical protein HXX76_006891 [Chlamydomonas incerta]|uniref:F-box domain-containing protein n=1 Tax=Chlamydomonas incerta TaxID=51695 RepID=A0A835T292_CHLIN|nr:hypothetical protein HXX76_006891 [Chlamydomonas incerta]|eukprot:KAG2435692.1 hypothetical protein HXX76_006891 [Chlamydomonas incerta]
MALVVRTLPPEVLQEVFALLSPQERHGTVQLVCRAWLAAVQPSRSNAFLFNDLVVASPSVAAARPFRAPLDDAETARYIRAWLLGRRLWVERLTVDVSGTPGRGAVAAWASPFGRALPVLAEAPGAADAGFGAAAASDEAGACEPRGVRTLTVVGPGVRAADFCPSPSPAPAVTPADAAGAVILGAFALPTVEELTVSDIPWAASLRPLVDLCASGCGLTRLRRLTLSRSFYHANSAPAFGAGSSLSGAGSFSDNCSPDFNRGSIDSSTASTTTTTNAFDDGVPLDGGAAEAWEALGALLGKLPCLEVLDLSYTHAMTYLDPARGAAAAPWPALPALRHLSLAHDLSVQPPPPAPDRPWRAGAVAAASAAGAAEVVGSGAAHPSMGARREAAPQQPSYATVCDGAAVQQLAHLSLDSEELEDEVDEALDVSADEPAVAAKAAEAQEAQDVDWVSLAGPSAAAPQAHPPQPQQDFDSSLLTVDAAHAAVELLTWLPRCAALVTLDLRGCGLEAVPLAVVHLRQLQRLDLQGNPLVSLRLPGPLESLTWLRLSTDPCYDMLYDMAAAEVGEAVAVDEMMVAELPTPALEELEVDSTSERALDAVAQAAAGLAALRRLVLVDHHSGVISSRVVQAA